MRVSQFTTQSHLRIKGRRGGQDDACKPKRQPDRHLYFAKKNVFISYLS